MQYSPTKRTTVRRLKKRGVYDKPAVHAILDEGFVCHVGFAVDSQPFVIPTLYARDGERLYFHGAMASRMLKTLSDGINVCLTVTLLDGLVLARSAFHHSINYRSVVVLGTARLVDDAEEKMRALHLITNHVVPGRWEEVRGPNKLEMKQTSVLSIDLSEVSAKVRNGPPVDDEEDYALPIWAGVVPVDAVAATPVGDGRLLAGTQPPDLHRLKRFKRYPVKPA